MSKLIPCTDLTEILNLDDGEFQDPPFSLSATELMEKEIAENVQAHRADDLFRKLVREGRRKDAEKVYQLCLYKFGIDLGAN